jgi:hypothetical protein
VDIFTKGTQPFSNRTSQDLKKLQTTLRLILTKTKNNCTAKGQYLNETKICLPWSQFSKIVKYIMRTNCPIVQELDFLVRYGKRVCHNPIEIKNTWYFMLLRKYYQLFNHKPWKSQQEKRI